MRKRWRGISTALIAMLLMASLATAAVQLQPDGKVIGQPVHPLSTIIKDDIASTVDANLNGIIDEAEGCPTCVGGSGGIDARFVGGTPFATLSSAINGQIYSEKFPIRLAPNAALTVVSLQSGDIHTDVISDGCSGGFASIRQVGVTYSDIIINWNARTLRGVLYGANAFGLGSLVWEPVNPQSNVRYYGVGSCPSPGCPSLMVDFDNRIIYELPLGGSAVFAGTVETYS